MQNDIAPINANVIGVCWPGDNWEGPLFYMQSMAHVKEVVQLFAQDIYNAAVSIGYLKINFIAHSLGNRLVLETTKQLLSIIEEKYAEGDFSARGLVLGNIAFMAGAVPVNFLKDGQHLRNAIGAYDKTLNIYSEADWVLHYAFPLGESAMGEGFLPIALGRKRWAGSYVPQAMTQQDNYKAGHSDYWGGDSKKITQLKQAANYVRRFIDMGGIQPRNIQDRKTIETNLINELLNPNIFRNATKKMTSFLSYNGKKTVLVQKQTKRTL